MGIENNESLRAKLHFVMAEGVGPIIFQRIVETFGDAETALLAPRRELGRVKGLGEKTLAAIEAVTEAMIDDEIALARRRGVEIIAESDPRYPAALRYVPDHPPLLYLRGGLADADAIALAIVGSRRCTHYGMEQAGRFGSLLGRAGYTVVSGGARGIDSAAHEGALSAGGRTIAVMGCGLATVYPPENAGLFESIVERGQGAIVSEFPMRTGVQGGNFPRRNRIISGLAQGVLVVEAARRSGSLITASLAGEQGRGVFAVPGRVDSPFSRGANDLIRDGAVLVQDLPDILENLGELGVVTAETAPDEGQLLAPAIELDETESKIVAALGRGDMTLDQLTGATALPAGKLAAALTMLSIKAVVRQLPGSVFTLAGTRT